MAGSTKSLDTIQLEYSKAKEQARKLDEIANHLDRVSKNQMNDTLSEIQKAWDSDHSKDYLLKGNRLQQEIDKRVKELRKTADSIREIAQKAYDTDVKAYQIVMQRSYK